MLKIAVLFCWVASIVAQHIMGYGFHGGNKDGFMFHYVDQSGMMVMITRSHCYLMDLTETEKMDVKDALKKEMLEMMMVTIANDPSRQTTIDVTTLESHIAQHCAAPRTVAKLTH